LTASLVALETCASYVGPYFISAFVLFLDGKKQFESQGYVLVCAFFVAKVLGSLSQRQGHYKQHQLASRAKATLTTIIYKKGLLLSSQSRQKHTSGEIINYMSTNVQNVGAFCWHMHGIWILPLQVVMAFIILYQNLGLTTFSGLAASLAVMLPNFPVTKLQQKFQRESWNKKTKG
jgi:ATP-binding cassette subfamily C (CFTR/MRP) protein 2